MLVVAVAVLMLTKVVRQVLVGLVAVGRVHLIVHLPQQVELQILAVAEAVRHITEAHLLFGAKEVQEALALWLFVMQTLLRRQRLQQVLQQ
jgi:hypothetical protein